MESADFWREDMDDGCEEKMPFLREMILIQHPGNHVVIVQTALHPCEESEKFLIGRIFYEVAHLLGP